jgi:uncharacterized membrane protein
MTDTSATVGAIPPGEFRVGQVLATSLSILFRNLFQFLLLSGLASLPYLIIYANLYDQPTGAATPKFGPTFFLAILLGFVLTALCQAVVLYGAFQVMRNRSFQIGESLSKGLERFLPVVGTSLCQGLAISFGAVLLLVPGFILLAMYYVALPVCVVERLGPFQSLRRSGALTKGHRWKVFGLAILLMISLGIVSSIIQALLAVFQSTAVLIAGMFIWEALARAAEAVVAVVAYHDLRVAKEGVDIEHIASVFD